MGNSALSNKKWLPAQKAWKFTFIWIWKRSFLRKGITIILGIQDENHETSLSNVDIYDNTLKKIKKIKNLKHNSYEFYLKNGFSIVGVIPDSNGLGRPDILMAKRVNGQS